MRPNRRRAFSEAFTLVELLTVISIISLLASILLPGLSKAKSSAQSARCKSNVRQIGLGLLMYVQDHAVYPPWSTGGLIGASPLISRVYWFDLIQPGPANDWTRSEGVYRCPAYKGPTGLSRTSWSSIPLGSYGYNYSPWGKLNLSYPSEERILVRDSAVVAPSDMIAIGDANILWDGGYPYGEVGIHKRFDHYGIAQIDKNTYRKYPRTQAERVNERRQIQKRHESRHNIAFCDGHIESIPFDKLYSTNAAALRRWNVNNEASWD